MVLQTGQLNKVLKKRKLNAKKNSENHQNVIVKGDLKLCFDAMECLNSVVDCLSDYYQYPIEHLGVEEVFSRLQAQLD